MSLEELIEKTKNLKLLYVEDEKVVRDETLELLDEFFELVDVAQNGKDGLEKYVVDYYDIVLSDINMPIMDGLTMCENIVEQNPDQCIVVLTAHDEMEYLEKMLDIGIDKYILKPLDFEDIINNFSDIVEEI
jgi:YesN/AraC family two-component response regulator